MAFDRKEHCFQKEKWRCLKQSRGQGSEQFCSFLLAICIAYMGQVHLHFHWLVRAQHPHTPADSLTTHKNSGILETNQRRPEYCIMRAYALITMFITIENGYYYQYYYH